MKSGLVELGLYKMCRENGYQQWATKLPIHFTWEKLQN